MEHRNGAESELSLHTLDLQPPVTKGHSRSPMQSACSHIRTCVVRVKNYVQFRSAMLLSKKTKNNRSIGFVILAKSDQLFSRIGSKPDFEFNYKQYSKRSKFLDFALKCNKICFLTPPTFAFIDQSRA